jgi:hypothetical protein
MTDHELIVALRITARSLEGNFHAEGCREFSLPLLQQKNLCDDDCVWNAVDSAAGLMTAAAEHLARF